MFDGTTTVAGDATPPEHTDCVTTTADPGAGDTVHVGAAFNVT